jgi:hypothetical protein
MITFSKPMVGAVALAVAGLFTALDMAQSRPEANPATTVAARFPNAGEMLVFLTAVQPAAISPKSDKNPAPASSGCTREHWPYIADECLTREGGKVQRPARSITSERRIAML